MAFSPKRKVICDMVLFICGHGGTGRLEGFRRVGSNPTTRTMASVLTAFEKL